MKSPLIFTSWQDTGLAQLEVILQRWGNQVRVFPDVDQLKAALHKNRADLVILDDRAAQAGDAAGVSDRPLLILKDGQNSLQDFSFPHHTLPLPLDISLLHDVVQRLLRRCQRRHLRMSVRLPGMVFRNKGCSIGDVLSLGTGGAFIKTGCSDLVKDEPIDVIIPLMGMKKEIELKGRVVYQVTPSPENNYMQGIGVSFAQPDPETACYLQEYISHSLMHEDFPEAGGDHPAVPSPALTGHLTPRSKDGSRRFFLHA